MAETEEVTGQKLIKAVRKLAADSPDCKYLENDCYYTQGECSNGTVGCIIGQALRMYGVNCSHLDVDVDLIEGVAQILPQLGIRVTADEDTWLSYVQSEQDEGQPWGEAVKSADEHALLVS